MYEEIYEMLYQEGRGKIEAIILTNFNSVGEEYEQKIVGLN